MLSPAPPLPSLPLRWRSSLAALACGLVATGAVAEEPKYLEPQAQPGDPDLAATLPPVLLTPTAEAAEGLSILRGEHPSQTVPESEAAAAPEPVDESLLVPPIAPLEMPSIAIDPLLDLGPAELVTSQGIEPGTEPESGPSREPSSEDTKPAESARSRLIAPFRRLTRSFRRETTDKEPPEAVVTAVPMAEANIVQMPPVPFPISTSTVPEGSFRALAPNQPAAIAPVAPIPTPTPGQRLLPIRPRSAGEF